MGNIKLLMFDLDGTLVNSITDITNSLNYALEPYGFEKLTVEKTSGMVGEGLTRLIEKVVGGDKTAARPAVAERFLSHYSEHLADFTLPYPHVNETLSKLECYRKAVISNKREGLSAQLLRGLGLDGYFEVVLGSDSVEEKKPSPRPLMKVLERMGLRPFNGVMIGDSIFDIEAGKAAGVMTIGVSYGFGSREELAGADYIIDDFAGLYALLREVDE